MIGAIIIGVIFFLLTTFSYLYSFKVLAIADGITIAYCLIRMLTMNPYSSDHPKARDLNADVAWNVVMEIFASLIGLAFLNYYWIWYWLNLSV